MEELVAIMTQIGLTYAYDHFAEGETPTAPFCVYLLPESRNFSADGIVYLKRSIVNIELYTEKKDIESEQAVEDVLAAHGIFYDKEEFWINSEELFEVIYEFTMEV